MCVCVYVWNFSWLFACVIWVLLAWLVVSRITKKSDNSDCWLCFWLWCKDCNIFYGICYMYYVGCWYWYSSSEEQGSRGEPSHRRMTHNMVERRRKDKIKQWISHIAQLLPPVTSAGPDNRPVRNPDKNNLCSACIFINSFHTTTRFFWLCLALLQDQYWNFYG